MNNGFNYNTFAMHYSMVMVESSETIIIGPKHFPAEMRDERDDDDDGKESG